MFSKEDLKYCGHVHDDDVLFQQMLALSDREADWLLNVQKSKISADDFYYKHRYSALGEFSYRSYVLAKLDAIKSHTSAENFGKAIEGTIFPNKGIAFEVPIEFTRFLMKSIKDRFVYATAKNKKEFFSTFNYLI